jgi:hypothetical protein
VVSGVARGLCLVGRTVWWLGWSAALVVALRVCASVLGRPVTAVVLGVTTIVLLVWVWGVYVEPRLFQSTLRPMSGDVVAVAPGRTAQEVTLGAGREDPAVAVHPEMVAAYLAKYLTKSTVSSAHLDRCKRRRDRSTRTGFCERHR